MLVVQVEINALRKKKFRCFFQFGIGLQGFATGYARITKFLTNHSLFLKM